MKGSLFKIKQHHAEWSINYIDDKPTVILDHINQALCKSFEKENQSVSQSALHWFMRVACALLMKKLEKIPARRNHIDVIEQQKVDIKKWLANEDMDFEKNCVFISHQYYS